MPYINVDVSMATSEPLGKKTHLGCISSQPLQQLGYCQDGCLPDLRVQVSLHDAGAALKHLVVGGKVLEQWLLHRRHLHKPQLSGIGFGN